MNKTIKSKIRKMIFNILKKEFLDNYNKYYIFDFQQYAEFSSFLVEAKITESDFNRITDTIMTNLIKETKQVS